MQLLNQSLKCLYMDFSLSVGKLYLQEVELRHYPAGSPLRQLKTCSLIGSNLCRGHDQPRPGDRAALLELLENRLQVENHVTLPAPMIVSSRGCTQRYMS